MSKRAFGELELAILSLFKSGRRLTVKEVHQRLGEQNKYTTIMTVMSRLAEKNVLVREKVGMHYEYWMHERTAAPSFLTQLKQKLLGYEPTSVVSYLLDSSEDLSDEELAKMEQMIAEARSKRNKAHE